MPMLAGERDQIVNSGLQSVPYNFNVKFVGYRVFLITSVLSSWGTECF